MYIYFIAIKKTFNSNCEIGPQQCDYAEVSHIPLILELNSQHEAHPYEDGRQKYSVTQLILERHYFLSYMGNPGAYESFDFGQEYSIAFHFS